jgi:hypothetical protein
MHLNISVLRIKKIAATLIAAQDDVDRQREALIAQIEGKLRQKETALPLFGIHWALRA